MDPRAINFNVLRRHDPQISSILDSTSYAVIYRYFHGAWSKTGFEGTLFIFQRGHSHPLYGVFVLNRQGLDNLCEGLLPDWDVDLDEGLIIWRSAGATGEADDDIIYGIWVYEEKDRTRIATRMQDLIDSASAQQNQPPPQPSSSPPQVLSLSHPVPRVPIITAGQTISLDQLFGVASICSDPPPDTSTLPHPASSLIDADLDSSSPLPSKVMSPDPSDLPKGMQLLDSLFQKAAIKSHTSHPSSSSNSQPTPTHHQPNSIHQLNIGQAPSSHSKPSSQTTTTTTSPKSRPNLKTKRDRRHGSRDDNSQSINHHHPDQPTHPNQRAINQHPSSRPDHRLTINSHNSRRSSAASSSHSRRPNPSNPSHPHPQPAPPTHLHPSNPQVSFVAAPVPIENANAEARHNILSLLGHPAAIQPEPINSLTTIVPNPVILASPPNGMGDGGTDWQTATSDDRARNLYSPQQQHPSANHHHHHHPYRSPGSQEPSPRQVNQQQALIQHPLPIPSYGNQTDLTPPRTGQVRSTNHSPNGPRPQIDSRQRHQLPVEPPPPDPVQVSSNTGQPTWPLDKLPNRALSPLNPARQSPSHRGGGGGGAAGYYQPSPNRKSVIVAGQPPPPPLSSHHLQQSRAQPQPKAIIEHSPPQVNDSSRPSRSHSYAGSHENNPPPPGSGGGGTNSNAIINPAHQAHKNHHPHLLGGVNPKIAVESLDSMLADQPSLGKPHHHHDRSSDDDNPIDKTSFANSILDLINNNGAFVDSLYARYLARYAEKYL